MKDSLSIKGWWEVVHEAGNGTVKSRDVFSNMYVDDGLAALSSYLPADVLETSQASHLAIGTDSTATSATDSALVAESHRETASGSRETTAVSNDTAVLEHEFTGYTGTEAVDEFGVFNDPSAGTMFARTSSGDGAFNTKNVDWDAGDSLTVTYKVQFTR